MLFLHILNVSYTQNISRIYFKEKMNLSGNEPKFYVKRIGKGGGTLHLYRRL